MQTDLLWTKELKRTNGSKFAKYISDIKIKTGVDMKNTCIVKFGKYVGGRWVLLIEDSLE